MFFSFSLLKIGQLYSCSVCQYKTNDKGNFEAHSRKHVKVKPFKCRICSARFETREQAGVHAKTHCPDYFKCGTCGMTFTVREQLVKHFDTHKQPTQIVQKQQVVSPIQQQQQHTTLSQQQQHQSQIASQDLTTQKLLQDTIEEALRETGDAGPKINFYSCHICSLTFIQETYYKQHMETHKRESSKKSGANAITTTAATSTTSSSHSLIRADQRVVNTPTTIIQTQTNNSISDTDLEIMFEKMHSDKAEIEGNANNTEGLVITSQESSTGGYTFNITMANQQDATPNNIDLESVSSFLTTTTTTKRREKNQFFMICQIHCFSFVLLDFDFVVYRKINKMKMMVWRQLVSICLH